MGHSTGSGRTSPRMREETAGGTDRQAAVQEVANNPTIRNRLAREIDRAKFNNESFGNWQFDIDGVGGGQILDESESRNNGYGRFGGKLYSVRTWNADYNELEPTQYAGSLNEAKRMVRNALHNHYGTRG